eukprot:9583520-Alexandrium_andersonii.AAC.1
MRFRVDWWANLVARADLQRRRPTLAAGHEGQHVAQLRVEPVVVLGSLRIARCVNGAIKPCPALLALPCPPLPCPTLPRPALPCPALR